MCDKRLAGDGDQCLREIAGERGNPRSLSATKDRHGHHVAQFRNPANESPAGAGPIARARKAVMPSVVLPEQLEVRRFAQALRDCPLCHSETIEYEFVVEGVAFSRCRACTLLFANPVPACGVAPSKSTDEAYAELRAYAARYLGREARTVLVVHAGSPPPDADATRVHVDDLDRVDGTFDLVVACNVLDRQPQPLAVCGALHRLVSADGALLVTATSLASDDARTQRDRWAEFRSKAAWWFTTDTLQLLITRAGFGAFAPVVDARDLGVAATAETLRFFGSHLALVARPVARDTSRLLSVIVPVFNEASTVAELLDRVLAKTIDGIDIEVLIVESNSTDGSREIVQRYAEHPRVRLVLEERPRGKGYAVRTGLEHARGEVVLFQDADLEYDVNDYDQLVEPLFALRRTFVLGSRHGASGNGWKIRRFGDQPLLSSVMNLAHLALLTTFNRLYRQTLFDPFTMYKVFRRDCLYGLSFECNRFDFDYEISIKLIRKGYQPIEIPVNYRSRSFGEGKKVSFFRDPPGWVRAMLRLRSSPLYAFAQPSGLRDDRGSGEVET